MPLKALEKGYSQNSTVRADVSAARKASRRIAKKAF